MTDLEISTFIEIIGEIGDDWTPEEVQEVYGNKTLDEALADRKSALSKYAAIVDMFINR